MEQGTLWSTPPDTIRRGAICDGLYRYTLWRSWDEQRPRVLFVLLNPSTANAEHDDPTLRRCLGFARREGCGSLEIVNLFAYRATQPALLKTTPDPVGGENNHHIVAAAQQANIIVAGWGAHGTYLDRDRTVLRLLSLYPLFCLGQTQNGQPKHPLYSPYRPLIPWSP